MQHFISFFGFSSAVPQATASPEPVSINNVSEVIATKVDEHRHKLIGRQDTLFAEELYPLIEDSFREKWTCRYKNYYLGETKSIHYEDENGVEISSKYKDINGKEHTGMWFSQTFSKGEQIEPDMKIPYDPMLNPNNILLVEKKECSDGKVKALFVTKTADSEHPNIKKITTIGHMMNGQRIFDAYKVVERFSNNTDHIPSNDSDFEEFCRVCNINIISPKP